MSIPRLLALSALLTLPTPKQFFEGHVARPKEVEPTPERLAQLQVPAGFEVSVLARELGEPRMMLEAPNGFLYVTRPGKGELLALQLTGAKAGPPKVVLSGHKQLHGLALGNGVLYLAAEREVLSAPLLPDGRLGPVKTLVADLPEGGQHPKRTIGFGPDGWLYLSLGSDCNDCDEKGSQTLATLLKMKPDGSGRTVFARGLRNTIGFGWHPQTHALWGWDHGIDWLGDDEPVEELNLLEAGKDYGWPVAYDDRKVNPNAKGTAAEKAARAARSQGPVLGYQAHSAPIWMLFYTGTLFPAEYRGDGFVAMHGSWNRQPPTGYKVVRMRFDHGRPVGFEDFLTGFLSPDGRTVIGRPAGLAMLGDGSLLVSDDAQGVIYRITHAPAAAHSRPAGR